MRAIVLVLALGACAVDELDLGEAEGEKQSANSLSENSLSVYARELNQLVAAPLRQSPPLAAMASSVYGRRLLHYVAHCALARGKTVSFVDPTGRPLTIPSGPVVVNGIPTVAGLGVAPDWPSRALTPLESNWVIGCLLAHVNASHKSVAISVRGSLPAFATTPAEVADHTFLEGAFFGSTRPPTDPDTAAQIPQFACWGPALGKCSNPVSTLWGRVCAHGGCDQFTVVGPCERTAGMPATTPVACDPRAGDSYKTCYTLPVVTPPGPPATAYTSVVTTYLHELSCDD